MPTKAYSERENTASSGPLPLHPEISSSSKGVSARAPQGDPSAVSCLPHNPIDEPPQRPQRRRLHAPPPPPAEPVSSRSTGKARVPHQTANPSEEQRPSARSHLNPFEAEQEAHKHEGPKGRQVVPREVDAERIHPSAPAMESQLDQRSNLFEQGRYTILPDKEMKYIPLRRMSSVATAQDGDDRSRKGGGMMRKPSLRLVRNNNDDDRLSRLMPKGPTSDDIRRDYANNVAQQKDANFLEAMIRSEFPVPRGPKVDCEFPPIHTPPSPRKHESHIPFLSSAAESSPLPPPPQHSGRRVVHPVAAAPFFPQHQPQPVVNLNQQPQRLLARGQEEQRGPRWNVITGNGW